MGTKFHGGYLRDRHGSAVLQGVDEQGTHVGSLWTANDTFLASATFTNETASGWQQVTLSNPVEIFPNTTYVVSYYAPTGHSAATSNYFYPQPAPAPTGGADINRAPLHALPNSAGGNGVYAYGSANANTFPTSTYRPATTGSTWCSPLPRPLGR